MNYTDQSGNREVRRPLKDLRTRTAASLQAFNDAVPYASWIRRSEIERFTAALLWAAERAPKRRQPTPLGKINNAPFMDHKAKNGGAIPLKWPDLNRNPDDKV